MTESAPPEAALFDARLFPNGVPHSAGELDRTFEFYKVALASAEAIVERRVVINTFFLSVNTGIVAALAVLAAVVVNHVVGNLVLVLLSSGGIAFALAWQGRITGLARARQAKLRVIKRLEQLLPAAITDAEWFALGEGADPRRYRVITVQENVTPRIFIGLYIVVALIAGIFAIGGLLPRS